MHSATHQAIAAVWRIESARTEFERAASLARNARKRELLLERARALDAPDGRGRGIASEAAVCPVAPVTGNLWTSDGSVLAEAAIDGVGIVLEPEFAVRPSWEGWRDERASEAPRRPASKVRPATHWRNSP